MGLIEINGRLVDDPFEMNRNIARCHDEIARLEKAFFLMQEHIAQSRKILDESHELLARLRSIK